MVQNLPAQRKCIPNTHASHIQTRRDNMLNTNTALLMASVVEPLPLSQIGYDDAKSGKLKASVDLFTTAAIDDVSHNPREQPAHHPLEDFGPKFRHHSISGGATSAPTNLLCMLMPGWEIGSIHGFATSATDDRSHSAAHRSNDSDASSAHIHEIMSRGQA